MKKLFILSIIASFSIVGCEKNIVESWSGLNDGQDSESASGKLVSAELINSASATDIYNNAINWVKSELGESWYSGIQMLDRAEIPNVLVGLIGLAAPDLDYDINDIPTFGVNVKTYRITYWTKGGFEGKEDIQLTADVCYATNEQDNICRKLERINVFNSSFNCAEGDLTSLRDLVIPMRALHNNLVVFPWYQGAMNDRGVHAVTPGEFLMKARQAVDAELAAIAFIESISEDEHVRLDEDYYTENLGVSNGGGTALAFQYLLEKEHPRANSERIRLKGTYLGEGCLSYSKVFPMMMTDVPCPDEIGASIASLDAVKPGAYLAPIVGAWYTYMIDPKSNDYSFKEKEMQKMFFSEKAIDTPFENTFWPKYKDDTTAENIIYASRYGQLYWGIYGDFSDYTIDTIINPDLLTEGHLDVSKDGLKELMEIFKKNDDKLLTYWNPQAKIFIRHSTADEFIPFPVVNEYYNILSNNGYNKNVTLGKFDGYGHIVSSLLCTLEIMFKKNPCPIDDTNKFLNK